MDLKTDTVFDTRTLHAPPLVTFEFRKERDEQVPDLVKRSIAVQPGGWDFGPTVEAMDESRIDPSRKVLPFAWGRMGGGTNTTAFAILAHLFGREASDALGTQFAQQVIAGLNSSGDTLSSSWIYRWIKEQA